MDIVVMHLEYLLGRQAPGRRRQVERQLVSDLLDHRKLLRVLGGRQRFGVEETRVESYHRHCGTCCRKIGYEVELIIIIINLFHKIKYSI